jgi:hypothetical protein
MYTHTSHAWAAVNRRLTPHTVQCANSLKPKLAENSGRLTAHQRPAASSAAGTRAGARRWGARARAGGRCHARAPPSWRSPSATLHAPAARACTPACSRAAACRGPVPLAARYSRLRGAPRSHTATWPYASASGGWGLHRPEPGIVVRELHPEPHRSARALPKQQAVAHPGPAAAPRS